MSLFLPHFIIYKKRDSTFLRSRTPSMHKDTSQPVKQILTFEPALVQTIDVHHPGPSHCLVGQARSQPQAAGGTGSDCSPLHRSVTADVCNVESCTNRAEEPRGGQGGPHLPLQLSLCKESFLGCFSSAHHALHWHPTCHLACFQVWRNSREVMP